MGTYVNIPENELARIEDEWRELEDEWAAEDIRARGARSLPPDAGVAMPEIITIKNYLNEKPPGLAIAVLVEETRAEFETPDGQIVVYRDLWYEYVSAAELKKPAHPLAA
mgnify:CR=1 FL=1